MIPDGSLELISFATLGKVVNLTPARPHGASATSSPRSSGRRRRRQDRRFSPRAAIRDRVRSGRDEIGREVRSSTGLPQPRCVRAVVGAGNQLDIDKLARPPPVSRRVANVFCLRPGNIRETALQRGDNRSISAGTQSRSRDKGDWGARSKADVLHIGFRLHEMDGAWKPSHRAFDFRMGSVAAQHD